MTFGPTVGNVGMYVAREMLASVPEDQRATYMRMVEEISELKYQLGVEVARQLPRLLATRDHELVSRYLEQVSTVAGIGWKSGVEVAKRLPDLYEAPDRSLAGAYVKIISQATAGPGEDDETTALADELDGLERALRAIEPKIKRKNELSTELAARDRRDEKRRKHAVELAGALPPLIARVQPQFHRVYLELVHLVAAVDPEAALEAADTLLDLFNGRQLSVDTAHRWVERGLEVLQGNREIGRGYFRLGSKQSLDMLEQLQEGLALKDVARVLKLFATALSGHDVGIRSSAEAHGEDPFASDHIVLPPEIRVFDDEDSNFRAYKVATAHGAGRIEFGTYRFTLSDIPETVAELHRRYPQEAR